MNVREFLDCVHVYVSGWKATMSISCILLHVAE